MDFPKRNFPYGLNQHEKQREMFAEFGTISGIDIQQKNGILDFTAHKSFCEKKTKQLSSARPTLPLNLEPEEASFPYRDRIMDELNDLRRVSEDFIRNVRFTAGFKKEVFSKELEDILKRIEKIENMESNKSRLRKLQVPQKVEKIVSKYNQCKNVKEVKNMNSCYTGGCLSKLSCDSDNKHILLSPSGRNFDVLKISVIEVDDNRLNIPVNMYHHNVETAIYEIQGKLVHNKGYCAVRGDLKTHVYMMNVDMSSDPWSPTLVQEMTFTDSRPTSVCLSPYIPGECLTATDDGTVNLWTFSNRCELVVDKQPHRFECDDQWRQCRFGAHPRQVILADNTAVQIFDIRTASREGCDLFALPSKYLSKRERVRVVEQHLVSPFLYVIATDYSLCLVDLRFPNNPLLQWQHLLRTPPSYISCLTNAGQENSNHVLIASQSPPDVCCYTFDYKQGEAPRSLESPWKLSKISDFTKWPEVCGGADKILVEDRLVTSLAGITSVDIGQGFAAYQLDSHGDVFYQVYEESANADNKKTFNWGPGSVELSLDEISVRIGKEWIQNLESQVFRSQKEIADMRRNTGTDVSILFNEIMTDHPAHVLCSFCMPKSKHHCDIDLNQVEIYCHNCQSSLQTSNNIQQSVDTDMIVTTHTQHDNTFDDDIDQIDDLDTSDALSKLMVKLWKKEHDIDDLIVERDENIKLRRKKKLKTDFKQATGDVSHDDTDISSVSDIEENISLGSSENIEQLPGSDVPRSDIIEKGVPPDVETSQHSNIDDKVKTLSLSNKETDILSCVLGKRDEELSQEKLKQVLSQKGDLRKRRHSGSSVSSVSSTFSSKSSKVPGFATTPLKHKMDIIKNSPKTLKSIQSKNNETNDSDIDDIYDRDFLQQNLHDSFSMFDHPSTSQSLFRSKTVSESVTKEILTKKLLSNSGTRSPSKSKRKYVSGF